MVRVIKYFASVFFIVSLLLASFPTFAYTQEEPPVPVPVADLLIAEVKVRYDSTSPIDYDEFIELYNLTTEPIDLSKYTLEYFNKTEPETGQLPTQATLGLGLLAAGEHIALAAEPTQIPNALALPFSSLSDSGGRLRLLDSSGDIIDELAWSSTQSLATLASIYPPIVYVCTASSASCVSRTQSMQREKDLLGAYVPTTPTWNLEAPSPQSSELIEPPGEVPEGQEGTETPEPEPVPALTCEGVRLSELLPNPEGNDTGHEFIELYNPTDDFVVMDGCSLQMGSNTYNFAGLGLSPGQYYALPDNVTGLTLPNAAGGTVWLLSPTEELDSVTYPGELEDDVAWAQIDNVWQVTYASSPNTSNILQPLKPCPEGQVRNSATNRCRSIIQTTSSLVPCREGQERNPETNRCRAVTAGVTLAACAEGQERNSETNRCRKVAGAEGETLAAVQDIKSGDLSDSPRWWIVGLIVMAVMGYGVYEWRRDVANWFAGFRSRFGR